MSTFGVAAPSLCTVCIVGVLLQLVTCSIAAGEASTGGRVLRGAANSSDVAGEAEAMVRAISSSLASLDAASSGAFVEEGYTSSGDNPSSAMENTSGVSGMAATIGKGNFSSTEISSMASDLRASSTSSSSLAANVYEHENWGGASQGIYGSTADLGRDWDNTISSLIIYPNWCITLYENSHYSGHWRRLCAGSSTWEIAYVGEEWNDRASSIQSSARR